jgi:tripartite-type tricarboxylate transporter receptor subunit TctC
MNRRQLIKASTVWLSASTLSTQTHAQTFPNKPIKILIGQPSGGAVDNVARLLSDRMAAATGVAVVVESRPGAAGMIAAEAIARSTADGYTLGLLDVGALAVNPSLQPKISYDIGKDFTYLGGVAKIPLVLVAHPSIQANNLRELTQYAKSNPGKLSYASAGVGSPLHLAFEAYKQRAGVAIVHIPYRGGAPALTDVTAGHVPLMFIDTNLTNQNVKAGRVKAIAIATAQRSPQLPDIATFGEAGIANFDFAPWLGVVAPSGIDAAVTSKLLAAFDQVTASNELNEKISALGFFPWRMDRDSFMRHVSKEAASYRELIQTRGIRLD